MLTQPVQLQPTCPRRSIMFYSIRAVQSSLWAAATDSGASGAVPLLECGTDGNLKSQVGSPHLAHIGDVA